jgi:hypothetical protein
MIDCVSFLRRWRRLRCLKPSGLRPWPAAPSNCATRCGRPSIPATPWWLFVCRTMELPIGQATKSHLTVCGGFSRIIGEVSELVEDQCEVLGLLGQ